MTKGEDLRVVKSIREIKQAFLRLILKKPMDKIKISDIADEALINRKTFYRHFTVLSDVPKRICSDFAEELSEGLKALDPENLRGGYHYYTICYILTIRRLRSCFLTMNI